MRGGGGQKDVTGGQALFHKPNKMLNCFVRK